MKLNYTLILLTFLFLKSDAQVNLQTGAAEFNLPIFQYADQNKLNTSVSLNYHSGNGLKVAEVASCVGTGWDIQAGGVITRQQRGLPDDQARSLILQNPLPPDMIMSVQDYQNKYYPNGYLYSYYSPNDNLPNEAGYIKMISPNLNWLGPAPLKESIAADREQDIFTLSFEKGTVDFVIAKGGQIKILNDSKFKIEVVYQVTVDPTIKTRIDKFIITDLEGIQYIFSEKELSQLCTYDVKKKIDNQAYITINETSDNVSSSDAIVLLGKKTPNYIVTKWYLSEIVNPRTGKKIQFNYEQYNLDLLTTRQINKVENFPNRVTINREILKALRIKKITCNQHSTVDFIYEESSRIDVPGEKPLKEIQIKDNGTLINKCSFQYAYFFTSTIKPYNYQFADSVKFFTRLCLQSVQKTGKDYSASEPPYQFYYNTGNELVASIYNKDKVPPMFTYWTDHWGYYNIRNNSRMDVGLIEYPANRIPTGHLSKECTEANANKKPYDGLAKNGIIKQITYPYRGTISYEYEQNDAYFNAQKIPVGGVRVKKIIQYDGINHSNDIIKDFKYTKEDGINSSGWGYEIPTYSITRNKRVFKQSNNKNSLSLFQDFGISTVKNFVQSGSMSMKTFNISMQGAAIAAGIGIIVDFLIDFFTDEWKEYSQTEYTNIAYQSGNSLPFQYSRVEVNDNQNGKIVQEFTSPQETPITIPTLAFPFTNKQRFVKWAYGLPKRTVVYDKMGVLIKETTNDYNIIASYINDANCMSKKWEANKVTLDGYPSSHTSYLAEYGNISEEVYYPQVGHTELISTKERVYKNAGYEESQTSYTYNPDNYQVKTIKTITSNGSTIEQRLYYPNDYTYGGIINDLKNANLFNTVLSKETWLTKNNQSSLINLSATDFSIAPNGEINPLKSYSLQTDAPVSQNVIGAFNSAQLIRKPDMILPATQFTYDAKGNLIQADDLQGKRVNASIYGYDDRFVIASVSNATKDEIAYTSFEKIPTTAEGNWSFAGVNLLASTIAVTGNNIAQLQNNSITYNKPVTRKTIVSLWSSEGNATVNGAAPIRTGPTINGWKYCEYEINAGINLVTVSGICKIDELRLYPKATSMVTTSYEPSVGKTSECDINNRIIYYEYDGLSRIIKMKDENRNIIKTYEYHFKDQQ